MILRTITKRTFNTIKSINDEQNNKALLDRLTKVPKLRLDVIVEKITRKEEQTLQGIELDKLDRLLRNYCKNPLIWESSTLSRVYKVPLDYCEHTINYVRPFGDPIRSISYKEPGQPITLYKAPMERPFVLDVVRLKYDKKYACFYQSLVFIDNDQRSASSNDWTEYALKSIGRENPTKKKGVA